MLEDSLSGSHFLYSCKPLVCLLEVPHSTKILEMLE